MNQRYSEDSKKTIFKNKIQDIHQSNLFGIIVECGCGACTSSALYEEEGASNTVYYTLQPYNKQFQTITYPKSIGVRSVSYEFVNDLLAEERETSYELEEKINFIFVSSFQLQGKDQSNLTHGWIGLETIDEKGYTIIREFYHLSIPKALDRKEYFGIISSVSIDLLYSKTNKDSVFTSEYIDNVKTIEFRSQGIMNTERDHKKLLEILNSIDKIQENFIVFNQHSDIIRMEDFCRDQKGIILLKGSFNPIHERHMELMEESKKLYPDYNSAFFISIGNRDKKDVNIEELLFRIKKITLLGYNVVVSKQAYFTCNVSYIRDRWKLPVILPVGYDTINRFMEDTMKDDEEVWKQMRRITKQTVENRTDEQIVESSAFRHFNTNTWSDVKFLVFHRQGYELGSHYRFFKKFIQLENIHKDELGISSTKIRNGEIKSKL